MMNETWPKALDRLKVLSEEHKPARG
jgi:hypothetical protein